MSGHSVGKLGVWVDNNFRWLDDPSWNTQVRQGTDTMSSHIIAHNSFLGIELEMNDVVYNEKDIFIREVKVKNLSDRVRQIKLFFNQQFTIYESPRGDTAYYDPRHHVMIHYKGRRVFLIDTIHNSKSFDNYSIGLQGIEGREGTFKDAEDGHLQTNHIEHGLVDSVIQQNVELDPQSSTSLYYLICVAKTFSEAFKLHSYAKNKTPKYLIDSTEKYWRAWVNKHTYEFQDLPREAINQFKTSLMVMRGHTNDNGSIIASTDSDLLKHGRVTYSYMWPRDGALVAESLDLAGHSNVSRRFFQLTDRLISENGYVMHKYLADESQGSSWHSWVDEDTGETILPIQEDETALIIYSLWEHYMKTKDLEFIESIYNSTIKNTVEFMLSYYLPDLNLPKPSYDLWEQFYAVSCFTACSVYAALDKAGRFADILGKSSKAAHYHKISQELKASILEKYYDKDQQYFYKSLEVEKGEITRTDKTVDISSVYAIFKFGLLKPGDEILAKAMELTRSRLSVNSHVGGIARFENDIYHRRNTSYPGNPWILTTLWMAQYDIAVAKTTAELLKPKAAIEWATEYAVHAGMLPEQLNPDTGAPLSATPLTWSHAEFVRTVLEYSRKYGELKGTA